MTTIRDITSLIEEFAPLALQQSYDNSGLVVGRPESVVSGVLLAVDVTEAVIEEAQQMGANLIITHHPIIFHALKRFNSQSYVERCVEMAIRSDIALYACHTNLDSTREGMSWRLGHMLSLNAMQTLEPQTKDSEVGFGVVGELAHSYDFTEFLQLLGSRLNLQTLRYSTPTAKKIRRVAICTGAGGSLMGAVRASGADLYITADLRYNDFMEPGEEFTVVDIGHFESEYCAIDILNDILSKKMFNFALRKSQSSCNPVNYHWF